jgi:hypothetical protein
MQISVSEAKTHLTDLVRRALIEAIRRGSDKADPGPTAARSQDFLYGDDGLPG